MPVGAYLLEAKSGSLSAREIVLVSDATLVLKSSATQALAFFTNALTGAPIANANVALWESYYVNSRWRWRRVRQTTDADGLARFQLRSNSDNRQPVRDCRDQRSPGVCRGLCLHNCPETTAGASTRSPIVLLIVRKKRCNGSSSRRHAKGGVYSTPANQTSNIVINDPRGIESNSGKATLNAFGSAWGSLELGEQLPLGEYSITFWEEGSKQQIGSAKLFRLEEYKLPEFKVQVKTPEQDGKKKAFRVGEKVEVEIQADYYFGGPVTNASVEVVVYQLPFYHYWYRPRDYSWYYDDYGATAPELLRRPGLSRETRNDQDRCDRKSEARIRHAGRELRTGLRVSHRSARGGFVAPRDLASDRVRVTRQRYYVYPRSEKYIYRPKDKVTVDIKALDANEQPVQTEGVVRVTRDYWWEIWIDPRGREVKGEELRQLRQRSDVFPPLTPRGQGRWRLKFRGYQRDEILTQTLKTDAKASRNSTSRPIAKATIASRGRAARALIRSAIAYCHR